MGEMADDLIEQVMSSEDFTTWCDLMGRRITEEALEDFCADREKRIEVRTFLPAFRITRNNPRATRVEVKNHVVVER